MTTRPLHPSSFALRHSMKRGFSFAEIMFAVMILAIGFIMVAAIFPVAIRQQQASMEDTSGVATAKRAAALIQQAGLAFAQYDTTQTGKQKYKGLTLTDLATTGQSKAVLLRFQDTPSGGAAYIPYKYIKGDLIQQSDRRLAWFPVAYQASVGSEYAKVYLVAVQSRANDQFTDSDRDKSETADTATPPTPPVDGPFVPTKCFFKLVEGGDSYPDTLVFTTAIGGTPTDVPAAAEGAFVWVADDNVTSPPSTFPTYKAPAHGDANGRFYRLGAKRDDLGTGVWELQPGYDMTVSYTPGPDNNWNTAADNQQQNENLPPRKIDNQPVNYGGISGNAASGLLVGRGRERVTNGTTVTYGNYAGNAMPLYALPPVTVRIHP